MRLTWSLRIGMSSVPLQVQFDPASARFGASRSQKRLEDERLLTGKGRYSDDLEFPRECWLVLVRAPHAHAPLVWPEATGNVAAQTEYGDGAAVAAAFARAAHVTELELHNQRVIAVALEPRACTGVFENERTTLYTQNQTPTGARDLLAAVFRAKAQDLRIVVGDIGGGFGMKTGLMPEDALVCYAARKLARPVRWRADRSEDFLAAHMGRDQYNKARLALDADGRILALQVETLGNIGAVPVGSSAIIPLQLGPKVQTTVYHVPLVHS